MSHHEKLAARERDLLWHTYLRAPRVFTRGSGTRLYDADGREYLDFLGGIATVAAGHANPHVVGAISAQLGRLGHTTNLYFTGPQLDLAERLVRHFGGGARVFLGNSGAEANEAAIKLARRWARANRGEGAIGVVSALGGFHGRTLATLAATGKPAMHEPFAPMPAGFSHVPYGDVDALADAIDDTTAAVLLEPIQGEAGVVVPPDGYLAAARKLTRDAGVLLILDEIQSGMGRTGPFLAHQRELSAADRPDIVTMAKALGNGFPIGACIAVDAVADAMRPGDHGTTFGGGPVACTAAMATLDVLEPLLPDRVVEAGGRLLAGLARLARRYGADGAEARGRGLWCALDLAGVSNPSSFRGTTGADTEAGLSAKQVALAALDQGLVVNPVTDTALRLAPPLTVTDAEVDEALGRLDRALAATAFDPASFRVTTGADTEAEVSNPSSFRVKADADTEAGLSPESDRGGRP